MKRIEIDPSDVHVVGATPTPRKRGASFGTRLKIAGVIAAGELVLLVFGDISRLLITAIAVLLLAFHFFVGRNLPTLLRQVSWVLALAQALVALFIVAIGISVLIMAVTVVLVLIIGLMLLLGDRG